MIEDADLYFTMGCGRCQRFDTPDCSALRWADGLADLRRICLEAGLAEAVKWGHPCYMHAGRDIAIIGAFLGDFRISFFNAALMKDPAGILERQGPNTRHRDMIRFDHSSQVLQMEPVVSSYLREAMGYADAGLRPPEEESEIELPHELVDALDSDPELAEAFRGLTPGRQKSYVISLNSTKSPATRTARIGKFREKILSGKGASER